MHDAFSPFERCRLGVVRAQEAIDGFPDLAGRGEAGALQSLTRQDAEPDFHLVEPTGMGWCVVPVHVGGGGPANDPASACACSGCPTRRESPGGDNR